MIDPDKTPTFQAFLKNAYAAKKKKNSQYSLRAFAGSIGLSPSTLTDVMSGKLKLSAPRAYKIIDTFELREEERKFLQCIATLECNKNTADFPQLQVDLIIAKNTLMTKRLDLDSFRFVADWYHLAILELLSLPHTQHTTEWIAEALQLSHEQVSTAIDRLIRLKLLEKSGEKWCVLSPQTRVGDQASSEAVRRFHRQILERTRLAIASIPMEQRSNRSIILSLTPDQFIEADRLLRGLTQTFSSQLPTAHKENAVVYGLTVHLVPLQSFQTTL